MSQVMLAMQRTIDIHTCIYIINLISYDLANNIIKTTIYNINYISELYIFDTSSHMGIFGGPYIHSSSSTMK